MRRLWLGLAIAGVLAQGCGKPSPVATAPTPAPSPPAPAPVVAARASGLGELMALAQMRQSKLWFAGESGNWKLAAYELSALRDALQDMARDYPTHKQAPVPINEAIDTIMTGPLSDLGTAIEKADRKLFEGAYDTVTDGCNACHGATDYGFIVIQRPKSNPYSNQKFPPEK